MSFWDIIWFIVVCFAFIAYLMVMFNILIDIFRDHTLSGWLKAVWVVCLIFFPLITALVYLVVRGGSMAQRRVSDVQAAKAAQDDYIRSVAGRSATEEIAQAKALLDAGTISQAEFDALKAKAVS
jgi:hypothetical protein